MEIISSSYETLKRCYRRRRYQRLDGHDHKKKLRIIRLGGNKIRTTPKAGLKSNNVKVSLLSPFKIFARLHQDYVDSLIQVANNVGKLYDVKGKRVSKRDQQVSMVSFGDEEVDARLVLEIYKRISTSRGLSPFGNNKIPSTV